MTTPKGLVLAICCCSLLIVSMDATAVNVALPSIRSDLHTTVATLQWTVDGYTLAIASFLLLGGATADRIGRRRVFQVGLVVFGLASLLCSLAPDVHVLVAARILQGLGGSMLNPVAMSIITNTFPDPRQRARAVGVWGAVVGVSMAFGPLVGGLLTEHLSWRAIFWINVPIAAAAVVLTQLFVPESRAAHPRRIDAVGQTLAIVLLSCLVYALIEAPGAGWGSPRIVGLLVVAGVLTGLWAAFDLAMGFLYGGQDAPADVSASRFSDPLPMDNQLPYLFARHIEQVGHVGSPMHVGDWLSSDRPPLQSAFFLAHTLWHRPDATAQLDLQVLATLLQSTWVVGVWALALVLTTRRSVRALMVAGAAASGQVLLNSFYTWPKLLAAAFTLLAVAVVLRRGTKN